MPKNATDYSKTVVYKIVCKNPDITDCYVGHTTCFGSRKSAHKNRCYNEKIRSYNYPLYKCIRENGGWENWNMVMLEECKLENSLQATARERHWFEQIHPTLNTQQPNEGTGAEWRDNNRDHIHAYNKQWRDNNPEYNKQWRDNHPEYDKKYRELKKRIDDNIETVNVLARVQNIEDRVHKNELV